MGNFTREIRVIKKANFPELLSQMWKSFKPEWAASGFQSAGVVPFNLDAVPVVRHGPVVVMLLGVSQRQEESWC